MVQQKKLIRTMVGESYNAHTAPYFALFDILPFDKLKTLKISEAMHKIYYKTSNKLIDINTVKKIRQHYNPQLW